MTASIILNAFLVISVTGACVSAFRKAGKKSIVLRYFTALSNMFCAAASFLMMGFSLSGWVPDAVRILKYSGTCAVTVTFLTVMLFLGPTTKNYKGLLSGYDFFLHLVCPLLAIISWTAFENITPGFYVVIFGTLPTVLYAGLYLYKVLLAPEGRRWDDFYGFNRGGKWPVSVAAMIMGAFAISVLLYVI